MICETKITLHQRPARRGWFWQVSHGIVGCSGYAFTRRGAEREARRAAARYFGGKTNEYELDVQS